MTANLPALQVVLPLLCAAGCVLLRSRAATWLVFLVAGLASLATAILLSVRVYGGETIRYAMGGWAPPAGIELVIDRANAPVILLVSATAVLVALYGRRSIEAEIDTLRGYLFYACLCLLLAGLLGIAVTGDAFNLFVFLEISSLSSYALVAMGRNRRALLASFQYLILGTIGGTFVLIGIGLAYAVTGTLNMADMAERLPELHGNNALTAAVGFVFVGLAIKMAVFPLHAWLPGVYAEAPSVVSIFLAATGAKVAIYAFIRFAFTVFGADLVYDTLPMGRIGLLVAAAAMLIGAGVACFQQDFKRLLAWSSIGQFGYIVAGFSLATASGLSAAYLHLVNHAIIKGALFCVAGILLFRLNSTSLAAMSGLGKRMPWTFGFIVLAGLGLVGVPLTAGFVSKWALAMALVEQGQWLLLAIMLVSSLLALVYVGRVIEIGWFRPPPETVPEPAATAARGGPAAVGSDATGDAYSAGRRTPRSMAIVTGGLVLASLYVGVDPTWPAALAEGAAGVLLGGSR